MKNKRILRIRIHNTVFKGLIRTDVKSRIRIRMQMMRISKTAPTLDPTGNIQLKLKLMDFRKEKPDTYTNCS
jgi:hypothetical protein